MTEEQVAWTAMPDRATVVDSSGNDIGTAESVIGDEDEDIFHGIAVRLKQHGRLVEIAAARIERITTARVYTTVPPEDVGRLPDYRT